MQRIDERLSSLDATFLELEQHEDGATMHIGGALIFEPLSETGGSPSLDALLELLDERLGRLPRFRMRLSEERVHGLQRPAWVVDPAFDLSAHVRRAALPAPGGDAQVDDWLGDFWSHRLDRSRPLWEMALVDGLKDGRWMLATKTHHAMVDGVGSVDIGHILLDAEPHPAPREAPEDADSDGAEDRRSRLPGWLPSALSAAHDVFDATVGTALHPRRLLKAGQATAAMAEVLWKDEVLGRPSLDDERSDRVDQDGSCRCRSRCRRSSRSSMAWAEPSTTSCSLPVPARCERCSNTVASSSTGRCGRWCRSTSAARITRASATR